MKKVALFLLLAGIGSGCVAMEKKTSKIKVLIRTSQNLLSTQKVRMPISRISSQTHRLIRNSKAECEVSEVRS